VKQIVPINSQWDQQGSKAQNARAGPGTVDTNKVEEEPGIEKWRNGRPKRTPKMEDGQRIHVNSFTNEPYK
jgi:hypothetical protein